MKTGQQHETDKYQHVNRTEIYEDRATTRNRQISTCKHDEIYEDRATTRNRQIPTCKQD